MIRLGMVGAGNWGRTLIRVITRSPQARLVALVSRRPEADALLPAEAHRYCGLEAMLSGSPLDGVVVALPPHLHAPTARRVIDAGLPLFLEKPMATTPEGARAVAERSAETGGIVMVDHIEIYHPAVRALMTELAVNGAEPEHLSGVLAGPTAFTPGFPPAWEYAPHFLAVAMTLFGSLEPALSVERLPAEPAAPRGERRELTRFVLAFAGGRTASFIVGNGTAEKRRWFEVAAGPYLYRYDNGAAAPLVRWTRSADAKPEILVGDLETTPLDAAIATFCDRIRAGTPQHEDARLGAAVVSLLADASTRLGDVIRTD